MSNLDQRVCANTHVAPRFRQRVTSWDLCAQRKLTTQVFVFSCIVGRVSMAYRCGQIDIGNFPGGEITCVHVGVRSVSSSLGAATRARPSSSPSWSKKSSRCVVMGFDITFDVHFAILLQHMWFHATGPPRLHSPVLAHWTGLSQHRGFVRVLRFLLPRPLYRGQCARV